MVLAAFRSGLVPMELVVMVVFGMSMRINARQQGHG
jgi:hypothetical protein